MKVYNWSKILMTLSSFMQYLTFSVSLQILEEVDNNNNDLIDTKK